MRLLIISSIISCSVLFFCFDAVADFNYTKSELKELSSSLCSRAENPQSNKGFYFYSSWMEGQKIDKNKLLEIHELGRCENNLRVLDFTARNGDLFRVCELLTIFKNNELNTLYRYDQSHEQGTSLDIILEKFKDSDLSSFNQKYFKKWLTVYHILRNSGMSHACEINKNQACTFEKDYEFALGIYEKEAGKKFKLRTKDCSRIVAKVRLSELKDQLGPAAERFEFFRVCELLQLLPVNKLNTKYGYGRVKETSLDIFLEKLKKEFSVLDLKDLSKWLTMYNIMKNGGMKHACEINKDQECTFENDYESALGIYEKKAGKKFKFKMKDCSKILSIVN